jgi:uncharacterized protein YkwD
LEEQVLELVNQRRSEGANCDGTAFGPTQPLEMDTQLRCAARLHAKDMVDRDFFSHESPDGEDPWTRIENAGFEGSPSGENIAAGQGSAEAVMQTWMESGEHCANIMSPSATHIGVGYARGGDWGHLWTQTFGRIE